MIMILLGGACSASLRKIASVMIGNFDADGMYEYANQNTEVEFLIRVLRLSSPTGLIHCTTFVVFPVSFLYDQVWIVLTEYRTLEHHYKSSRSA